MLPVTIRRQASFDDEDDDCDFLLPVIDDSDGELVDVSNPRSTHPPLTSACHSGSSRSSTVISRTASGGIQVGLDVAASGRTDRRHGMSVITGSGGGRGGGGAGSGWLRTVVGRTTPGAFLLNKIDTFRQRRRESNLRRITEKELLRLNRKIEKLLTRLEDVEQHSDSSVAEDEECVICLSARATMQTFPCAHRVACRRCFVRTIQTAIAERSLPLRCVVCRTRILRLNDPTTPADGYVTSPLTAAAAAERFTYVMASSIDRKGSSLLSSTALNGVSPLVVVQRSQVTASESHKTAAAVATITAGYTTNVGQPGRKYGGGKMLDGNRPRVAMGPSMLHRRA